MKQNDFERCTFVVAKDDGKNSNSFGSTAICREHLYCKICQYCSKHCLDHMGTKKQLLDWAQNKKAVTF